MKRTWQRLLLWLLCALPAWSALALPAGISGSWFNPAQGGHGLSVQVLDDGRALAFWFVYDPQGNPIHLYVDGIVHGDTIAGTAYYNEGMRFGVFDPAARVQSVWGEVELTFIDCDHGWLRYDADGPAGAGYGSGSMPLIRLSYIATQGCAFERETP